MGQRMRRVIIPAHRAHMDPSRAGRRTACGLRLTAIPRQAFRMFRVDRIRTVQNAAIRFRPRRAALPRPFIAEMEAEPSARPLRGVIVACSDTVSESLKAGAQDVPSAGRLCLGPKAEL